MEKVDDRPKGNMRLTIEFADNGIILRNPDIEDEVTLAITERYESRISGPGFDMYETDHTDEYKAIGKKVYDWIDNDVVRCNSREWLATGVEISITAILQGRERT